MSSDTPFEVHQSTKSYKHMWARGVAQATMAYDLKGTIDLVKESVPEISAGITIGELSEKTKDITGEGFIPKAKGKIDVGIVGAGVAGMFAALLFDWLNDHPKLKGKNLKINYDILEAAGAQRLGGRLYTHHFSNEEHDYYDVGAMRFPNNSIMRRQVDTMTKTDCESWLTRGAELSSCDKLDVCPSYFNDVSKRGNIWADKYHPNDPYKINKGLPPNGQIPKDLLKKDPSSLVGAALDVFMEEVKQRFDDTIKEQKQDGEKSQVKNDTDITKSQILWQLLMKADHMSVRQFLGSGQKKEVDYRNAHPKEDFDFPLGPGYNFNTIEWLETATYGTGWYDQSLTECVLEELDFHTDDMDNNPATKNIQYWWCIDGGAQEIARKMATKAKKRVEFNTRVQSIDAQVPLRRERRPDEYTGMKIKTTRIDPKTNKVENKEREYFAIFNSTTLAALQRMELRDAGLSWGTKQAIRALGYGSSSKVGMKFRTAWWQKEPFNIKQGGVSRTDLPLRVCVYPSYNIEANEGDKWDPEKPAVLLCSYTWGQDAQRIGSLCSRDTPNNEEELKRLIIHDLARLHARKEYPFKKLVKFLDEQYVDHHGYDWYRDQHMSGAFAYFGPGQFSNMWQEIIKPNSFGQLYLVGEASSSHHAWIVGALESVIRAVYVMFQGLQNGDKDFEAYRIVLDLLRRAPTDQGEEWDGKEDILEPLKRGGAMPTGLPFHPLPEEMPTTQKDTENKPLTDFPDDEAGKEFEMSYGAALAVLSVIESFFELGLDKSRD
ncbi:hypothetical protein ACHAPU_008171 [Fusarium lateritium]